MSKTLRDLKKGQKAEIIEFTDNEIRLNSARIGIEVGNIIKCVANIGPVVIRKNQQQIAIGEVLSQAILVREV